MKTHLRATANGESPAISDHTEFPATQPQPARLVLNLPTLEG